MTNALWVLIDNKIETEAIPVARVLHEANRVLLVFGDPEQDKLLRLWLEDEGKRYIKPEKARQAHARYERLYNEAAHRQGLPTFVSVRDQTEQMYDHMSRTAHNRRASCLANYSEACRRFTYGPAPSVDRLATAVEWTAAVTVDTIISVGDALSAFYGRRFFPEQVAPLRDSVEAARRTFPLSFDSLSQAAA